MKAFLIYEGQSQFIVEAEDLAEAELGIVAYNKNGLHVEDAKIVRELTEEEMKSKEETGRYELEGAEFTEGEELEDAKE